MRMSLSVNGTPRVTASLTGPGYLSAHLNMSDRPKEGTLSRHVRFAGHETHATETVALEWPTIELQVGDAVELRILPDGDGDPPSTTRLSSEVPTNLLSRADLAKDVVQAVADFHARLMELLTRAEGIEPADEYQKFRRAIGRALYDTGEALLTPIERRRKELIPEVLKGELL